MAVRNAKEAKRQAQQEWRRRDREVSEIEQVNVRAPIKKENFKRFGELLRERGDPRKAFQVAFPRSSSAVKKARQRRVRWGFQVSRSIRVCGLDPVSNARSLAEWRDDRGPERLSLDWRAAPCEARRPDRRCPAAIRRVNLQGFGPSTPAELANSNTSAEPECLENAAISAFFTGD